MQTLKTQYGQSMTQYLILTFMLAVGSLVVVGQAGQVTRNQVASVSHEVSGNSVKAKASTAAAQENAKYASDNASTSNTLGGRSASTSNPVTSPTGPNTAPSIPTNPNPSADPNNPITNPGETGTSNTGITGTGGTNTSEIGTSGNGVTGTGETNIAGTGGADTGGITDILPPPLCTKTTPEQDTNGAKEEDKGFWGSLWSEVKDGLVAGYEFVKGFWAGMKQQVTDLGNLLAHPFETAKGLIALGKQFIDDPVGTAKMIAQSLGEEFSTLVDCGAYDKGRVIGENVSPAFMVKLASKMARYGKLARALRETKLDFGCASFAANTPIWTVEGKVNVESLTKGNVVLSRNEKGYEDKPQKITNTFGRTADHYYELKTEFDTIKVTAEHPMWKQGRGWTEVQYLKVDDVVASADGDVLILDNQRIEKPLQVYNFTVENTPSYFAGESKLWVHNAKCEFEIIDGVVHPKIERTSFNGKDKILNKPEPSTVYKVNGRHTYKTDKYGRPESVQSTVELKDLDTTARNYYQQCKIGNCGIDGDEGGHLIATKLGGPGEAINLVPQNFNLNRGKWRTMERGWGIAASEGKKVEIDIKLEYIGDAKRPDRFLVSYKIDGVEYTIPYKNQPGG